mmetsp:Transcript_41644/g.114888  ORF Transcript_41644/g.114888 Transcript_41644/m.114888 type:complete len:618 (-) Transcript_41644:90-1943(-)
MFDVESKPSRCGDTHIAIKRHGSVGIYKVDLKHGLKSSNGTELCTLRSSRRVEGTSEHSNAITISDRDTSLTLQPWDPSKCIIAAGLRNRLVHSPIEPGCGVCTFDCSLETLSHLADIVGETGRVVGFIDEDSPTQPAREELLWLHRTYPNVTVAFTNVKSASIESYECLLSLPESSKIAFQMAFHPRLGASSPARVLATAPPSVVHRIYRFLECGDLSRVSCFVCRYWPQNVGVDVIRSVVLQHIQIIKAWRPLRNGAPGSGSETDITCATETDAKQKGSKAATNHKWVFLELPTHFVGAEGNAAASYANKLTGIVQKMKRLASGLRTGLYPTEQLDLAPYFPKHALLLMKYDASKDECFGKTPPSKIKCPPGLDGERCAPAIDPSDALGPSIPAESMPMPSFMQGLGDRDRSVRPPYAASSRDHIPKARTVTTSTSPMFCEDLSGPCLDENVLSGSAGSAAPVLALKKKQVKQVKKETARALNTHAAMPQTRLADASQPQIMLNDNGIHVMDVAPPGAHPAANFSTLHNAYLSNGAGFPSVDRTGHAVDSFPWSVMPPPGLYSFGGCGNEVPQAAGWRRQELNQARLHQTFDMPAGPWAPTQNYNDHGELQSFRV